MKAWYFARDDKRLRYNDGREIVLGETHEVSGELGLCANGLHASKNIMDALSSAPGLVLYRVELSGDILRGDDKSCASKRTYVSGGINIQHVLREFARRCALDVVHLWDAPEIVVRYLKTGDDSIRAAARDAAWDATRDATGAAAGDAARTSAWDATGAAAGAAAWAAAGDATGAAAGAAAWAAAWDAAWDAAGAAARGKQRARLTSMVISEMKKQGVWNG